MTVMSCDWYVMWLVL